MKFILFVIVTYHSSIAVVTRYNEPMTYRECQNQAYIEKERLAETITDDVQDIDLYCGTNKTFLDKYKGVLW